MYPHCGYTMGVCSLVSCGWVALRAEGVILREHDRPQLRCAGLGPRSRHGSGAGQAHRASGLFDVQGNVDSAPAHAWMAGCGGLSESSASHHGHQSCRPKLKALASSAVAPLAAGWVAELVARCNLGSDTRRKACPTPKRHRATHGRRLEHRATCSFWRFWRLGLFRCGLHLSPWV